MEKKYRWIKYSEKKPLMGELVLIYRDIEICQMYVQIWDKDAERFADWNEITYWMRVDYPPQESPISKISK